MSLPKIDVPTYTMKLPSTDKTISYRPFLVKEEKILLMATMSNDEVDIKNAIKQIIRNCVLDADLKIDNLTIFDIEAILINLRMRSIGNNIENEYVCNNVVNDIECKNSFKININLEDVKIEKQSVKEDIWLSDKIGVKMKWPGINSLSKNFQENAYDFEFISDCIEYVFDKDNMYKISEQSPKETQEFLESLTREQHDRIVEYIRKIPIVKIQKEHTCEKCGFKHTIGVENILGFF